LNDARLARCYFFSIGPRGSRGTVDAGPRGAGASGGVGDEASYRSGRGAARAVARASRARGSRRRTHLPQERGPGRGDAVRILPELVLEGLQVRRARAGDELVLHPRVRRRGGARGAARGGGVRPRLERAERRGRDPAAQRARATTMVERRGARGDPARARPDARTGRARAEGKRRGAREAQRAADHARGGVASHGAARGGVRRGGGGGEAALFEPTETSTTIRADGGHRASSRVGKYLHDASAFPVFTFCPGRCPSSDFFVFSTHPSPKNRRAFLLPPSSSLPRFPRRSFVVHARHPIPPSRGADRRLDGRLAALRLVALLAAVAASAEVLEEEPASVHLVHAERVPREPASVLLRRPRGRPRRDARPVPVPVPVPPSRRLAGGRRPTLWTRGPRPRPRPSTRSVGRSRSVILSLSTLRVFVCLNMECMSETSTLSV